MEKKIKQIHLQLEQLFANVGIETYVSIKEPNGQRWELLTARKGTLKEISKDINKLIDESKK